MNAPDDGQDVIEHGDERDRPGWAGLPGWSGLAAWAGRRAVALSGAGLGVGLAVGLIAGYLAGHREDRAAEPARPTATAAATSASAGPPRLLPETAQGGFPALAATGNRCAVQHGATLQLGVEVANQSDHAVAVGRFHALLPMGGLRATEVSMGTCGALPTGAPMTVALPAGATAWLSITFRVLVRCPQPYPVQFLVGYTDAGKPGTVQLDEFPDLGQVAYNDCGHIRPSRAASSGR